MLLHEDLVVELLPAERDIPISYKRAALDAAHAAANTMQPSSSAIAERAAASCLTELPFGAAWRRFIDEARRRGPVTVLERAHVDSGATLS